MLNLKKKECNVLIRGLKKMRKHEAEEKVNDISSFLEVDTDPVKIDPIGTTNEQNMQLLLMKMPNPRVKWELIRKAKKLRGDTGFDSIYINPDLTPEQRICYLKREINCVSYDNQTFLNNSG